LTLSKSRTYFNDHNCTQRCRPQYHGALNQYLFSAGFMQKKVLKSFIASALLLSVFSCSEPDTSTGVGVDLVEDVYPGALSFEDNFHAVSAGSSIVVDSFVLPRDGERVLQKRTDTLAVGTFDTINATGPDPDEEDEEDTLFTSIESVLNMSFELHASSFRNFRQGDSVSSVQIIFDTVFDTVRYAYPSTYLKIYSCPDTTDMEDPFKARPSSAKLLCTPTEESDSADGLYINADLSGTDAASTVASAFSSLLSCLEEDSEDEDDGTTPCDSLVDTTRLHFMLFSNLSSSLITVKSIRMVVSYNRDTSRYVDSLSRTVLSDTIDASRCFSIRSRDTRITTVFKVDMSFLWDAMEESSFDEILSASFVVPGFVSFSENDSDSVSTIRYLLSSTAYRADSSLDLRMDSAASIHNSTGELAGTRADSLVLPVDFFLQHYISLRPRYFYLYLQNFSTTGNMQQTSWIKPRFKAVLTTFFQKSRYV